MIKALIIDDEEHGRLALEQLLTDYCPDVEILGLADSIQSGIQSIQSLKPDLVFLDISMPEGQGFEVLEATEDESFKTVFVTAHAEHAIRAFEYAAIHYLLKPVNIDHLRESVSRYKQIEPVDAEKISVFQKESSKEDNHFIMFKTLRSTEQFDIRRISHFRSDGKYSYLYDIDGNETFIAKPMREIENLLTVRPFYRVHRSYFIHMDQIASIKRRKSCVVTMKNGTEIEVAARRVAPFMKLIRERTNSFDS